MAGITLSSFLGPQVPVKQFIELQNCSPCFGLGEETLVTDPSLDSSPVSRSNAKLGFPSRVLNSIVFPFPTVALGQLELFSSECTYCPDHFSWIPTLLFFF